MFSLVPINQSARLIRAKTHFRFPQNLFFDSFVLFVVLNLFLMDSRPDTPHVICDSQAFLTPANHDSLLDHYTLPSHGDTAP